MLAGRPIISYTLQALAAAGIREATVVTGYRELMLRAAVRNLAGPPQLTFASNPRFADGASYSLAAARHSLGNEPFLLLMADHLVSIGLIARLLEAARHNPGAARSFVAADAAPRDPAYAAEATKLALSTGAIASEGAPIVTAIGKQLPTWDALDCGSFILQPHVWDALDAVPGDCELSTVFGELVRRGQLFAADVSGEFWYDIDTPEDLAAAERLLARRAFSAAPVQLEPPAAAAT